MPRRLLPVTVVLLLTVAAAGWRWLPGGCSAASPTADVPWGVPDRAVKIASFNTLSNERGEGRVLAELRATGADFLLLQEVQEADASDMAEALGMRCEYVAATFPPDSNVRAGSDSRGSAILTNHPLGRVESLQHPGGGSFGLWAEAAVDGRRFVVASVHLSATWNAWPSHVRESGEARWKELSWLIDAWQRRGGRPLVVAGDFNQLPVGNNYFLMTEHLTDALATLGRDELTFRANPLIKSRIDYVLLSDHWHAADGGVVRTEASDHELIWASLRPATRPTGSSD